MLLPEVNGDKEHNATLALNWYLNQYLCIGINYVHMLDIDGGSLYGKKLDAPQIRFQLAY